MNAGWVRALDGLPPRSGDGDDRSSNVLILDDTGEMHIGYVQYYPRQMYDMGDGDHQMPRWKLAGRDYYDAGNVLWWTPLPPGPPSQGRRRE